VVWFFISYMYTKHSGGQGDGGPVSRPVRTSGRLRRRPKQYGRTYGFYSPTIIRTKKKTKTRAAASRIAEMLRPGNRISQTNSNVSS